MGMIHLTKAEQPEMLLSSYVGFEHLRHALFWEGGSQDLLVNLTAYFDASGASAGQIAFAVGGWISTVEKWTQFNFAWREMLNVHHADIFHASELETLKGRYSGWSQEQKLAFQNDAYTLIERFAFTAISAVVVKTDFDRQFGFENYKKGSVASCYNFCMIQCMGSIVSWANSQHYNGEISYIFEAGDEGQGGANVGLAETLADPEKKEKFLIGSYAFSSKESAGPLQAADIWAYEICKHAEKLASGKMYKDRYPFKFLWHPRFQTFNTYWDATNLHGLAQKYIKRGH
jgi:hypothetical protein